MLGEQGDERRARRIREAEARSRSAATRRAILDLLRRGPLSAAELRAKLAEDASVSVVDYHLGVLLGAGEIVSGDDDRYRLA